MTDHLGTKGVKELDQMLNSFVNLVNKEDNDLTTDDNDFCEHKSSAIDLNLNRKYIPMTWDSYNGSAKQVYNTKHM